MARGMRDGGALRTPIWLESGQKQVNASRTQRMSLASLKSAACSALP